jgi:hypothetical protein
MKGEMAPKSSWLEVDMPPVFAGAGCSTIAVMVEAVAHSTALRSPEKLTSLIADKKKVRIGQ